MNRFVIVQSLPNGLVLRADETVIAITALRPDIWRVRIGRHGELPEDASWAVREPARHHDCDISAVRDDDALVTLRTSQSVARVSLASGALEFIDAQEREILADAMDSPFETGRQGFVLNKTLGPNVHIFGLGDKPTQLDHRQQSFSQWNTDSYAFHEGQNPLYKDIPFFMGFDAGRAFGMLLDNTWRKFFDFGVSDPAVIRCGALGGDIDYYVLTGPTPKDVVTAYHWLTGPPPLPPKWALGYQQSRYSYETEDEVRTLALHLRENNIPSDVIWLDLHALDRRRSFTIDDNAFPTFRKMIDDLHVMAFKVVLIADLHIARVTDEPYAPYRLGLEQNAFVHTADGTLYVDEAWGGPSVFPDFADARARAYWAHLFQEPYGTLGVDGIWNDMNEPAIFNGLGTFIPEVRHRIDAPGFTPRNASHAEIHNVYGMLNARATREGLLNIAPDRRPFVMMRASYAGGHRYGVTWTGDNVATWQHLRLSTPMLLSLGLSGFSFAGANLGGFVGSSNPDLLTRWLQVGMFNPIADNHADLGTRPQEPWVDGPDHLRIRREAIAERYRLLPYLYTLAEETSRTGMPMMRPLFLEFPSASGGEVLDRQTPSQFMLGADLLIAPPPYGEIPGEYEVTLPPGGWYDFRTGYRVETDRRAKITGNSGTVTELANSPAHQSHLVTITPVADRIPVYARAGAIIPHHDTISFTSETPSGPLRLAIYAADQCDGDVYDDDGESFGYRNGDFLRQHFTARFQANGRFIVTLGQRAGNRRPWWTSIEITIHGLGSFERLAEDRPCQFDPHRRTLIFNVAADIEETTIIGYGLRQKSSP